MFIVVLHYSTVINYLYSSTSTLLYYTLSAIVQWSVLSASARLILSFTCSPKYDHLFVIFLAMVVSVIEISESRLVLMVMVRNRQVNRISDAVHFS